MNSSLSAITHRFSKLVVFLVMAGLPVASLADDKKEAKAPDEERKTDKDSETKPVPLDAKADVPLNQLNDKPGRVVPLAKRPVNAKLMLVSKVAREIAQQAREEWKKDRAFRRYSDYSSHVKFGLTNRQIITALMKRQDSHPAVDAYVRWQLLSFAPDFNKASEIELHRLAGAIPKLTHLPPPPKPTNILKGTDGSSAYFFSGTQRAFLSDLVPVPGTGLSNPRLSVINSGTGISAAGFDPQKAIETARSQTYDYVQAANTVEYLNGPAVHFRDAFVRMVPDAKGYKLELLFDDMKDRIEAGDPGYKDAAQLFFNEAQRTRNDADIPEQTRRKLIHQMRNLSRDKTYVVEEIQIDNGGNLRTKFKTVAFPKQFVPPLIENLKGPTTKPDP